MKIFNASDIKNMEQRYRVNLISNISGLRSANLIATKSESGQTNVSIFNTVTPIGSNPPLIGFIMRPTHVERHTYENILETQKFTINQINTSIFKNAHLTSAKYPREVSEFESCGLEQFYHEDFEVPYVKGSLIKIGLTLEEEIHIRSNDTRLIIGSVDQVICEENVVEKDGHLNHKDTKTIAIGGLETYYQVEYLGRFGYARPGEPLQIK